MSIKLFLAFFWSSCHHFLGWVTLFLLQADVWYLLQLHRTSFYLVLMCDTAAFGRNGPSWAGEGGSGIIPVWQEPPAQRAPWKVSAVKDVEEVNVKGCERRLTFLMLNSLHKGPEAGEGPAANEVWCGQRKQWSTNREKNGFTRQIIERRRV